ncbi:MAG TPA: hypothetical protein VN927_03310 [Gemmatimonadaceae bacterium]|nr:hypothetical protein [Gemmatimonadaceae bacterium]
MGLGEHSRNKDGRYRQERSDSKAKNLAAEYPEFKSVPPEKTFGQIKKQLGTTSMDETRKALRKQQRGR